MKAFGRAQGKSGSRATSAAAYRAGERIRDERTRRTYDHRGRTDVMHKEIVLPSQLAAHRVSLAWARERTTLWNAAEHAESRRNGRVAREFVVALPHELAPERRTQLAREFAQHVADRYLSAVDVAIHAPREDARNFHAHLLATTREITVDGLGRKTTLELNGTRRHELGLPRWRDEIESLRKSWAELTNDALEKAQVAARVTHLSRAERGLGPSEGPTRVPLAAYHMEKRGAYSFIAEKTRARHRADLERARLGAEANGRGDLSDVSHVPSGERTLPAIGRSRLREFSARVTSVWRELQEKLSERRTVAREATAGVESGAVLTPVGKATVAAMERSRPATREELRASVIERVDEAARSVRNWLDYREKQRAREAAGLDSGLDASERGLASESRAKGRDHDNDFSL